ncbi:MAG: hypothetical protein LBC41_03800, partial [Clostridiales bacterium]|nr:hypothetical protein [Clostridiales bacterium]
MGFFIALGLTVAFVIGGRVNIGGEYYFAFAQRLDFCEISFSSSDLEKLSKFTNVINLTFLYCKLNDITSLSNMHKLESLV